MSIHNSHDLREAMAKESLSREDAYEMLYKTIRWAEEKRYLREYLKAAEEFELASALLRYIDHLQEASV